MADGGVGDDIVMLVLGYELWCQVLPHMSAGAVVTGFSAAWLAVPHELDESVHTFVWPVPTEGSFVTVEEPDADFLERLESAGVRMPDPKDPPSGVELLEQFEDEPEPTDPGSFVISKSCLNCGEENLWIEGGVIAIDFIEAFATEHKLDKRTKKGLLVLRCASCLQVHLDHTPLGLVTYTIYQA